MFASNIQLWISLLAFFALRCPNAPRAQDLTMPLESFVNDSRIEIAFESPLLAKTRAENPLMLLLSELRASIKNSEISFLLRKRELNASPLISISESSSFDIILLTVSWSPDWLKDSKTLILSSFEPKSRIWWILADYFINKKIIAKYVKISINDCFTRSAILGLNYSKL